MKRKKLLAFIMASMLVVGNCMPSVTAYATEGDDIVAVSVDESTDVADDVEEEGELEAFDDEAENLETPESEDVAEEQNLEVTDAVFEGQVAENKTYDDGNLPVVTEFGWRRVGCYYLNLPDPNLNYYVKISGPVSMANNLRTYSGDYDCPYLFTASGDYTIQVKTCAASERDDDFSRGVVSEIKTIHFEKPDQTLATPTGLHWHERNPWTAVWNAVEGANYYEVFVYKNGTQVAGISSQWNSTSSSLYWNFYSSLKDEDPSEDQFTFTVKAFNVDPSVISPSAVSERSAVYAPANDPSQALPKVTELRWKEAGWAEFTSVSSDVYYSVQLVFPDGSTYSMTSMQREPGEKLSLFLSDKFLESGKYKFRVKTTYEQSDYNFSQGVVSDYCEIDYVRPDSVYKTPTKLYWSEDGVAHWTIDNAGAAYIVSLYKNGSIYSSRSYVYGNSTDAFKNNVNQPGNWTFTVTAYCNNPVQIASSPESEQSFVYDGTNQYYNYYPQVTDAKWSKPGTLEFTCPRADVYYTLFIRNSDGNILRHPGFQVNSDGKHVIYNCAERFMKSGTYSFAVKTTDKADDYDEKTGSVTDWIDCNYVRPENAFEVPSNLRWLEDGTATWNVVPGNPYYQVIFFKDSEPQFGTPPITATSYKSNELDLSEGEWTFRVRAYGADPSQTAPSELSADSPVYGEVGFTGLADSGNGTWYLYDNGEINTSFSGLYNDEKCGWWLVLEGRVAFEYSDLYDDANLGWWKINGGQVDFGYTDLYCSPKFGWWKIVGGQVDFGFTDLYCSPQFGWWKIIGGQVDFGYSDLYGSPTCGWWLVTGGAVDFDYTDLYGSPTCGWWKVTGGAVDFEYSDLYGSPTCGWWLVTGGAVDFGFTDLYGSPTYGWWKVTGGAVDFGYTDLYGSPTCGWWLVSGGAVDFGYTDIYASPSVGNWKVSGGTVDFGFNGVYNSPRYGQCYVSGGQANL